MQPSQAYLGDRSRTSADDQTRIARKGHQQIARIAHAARDEDRARPVVAKVLAAARRNRLEKLGFVNSAEFAH